MADWQNPSFQNKVFGWCWNTSREGTSCLSKGTGFNMAGATTEKALSQATASWATEVAESAQGKTLEDWQSGEAKQFSMWS